MEFTYNCGTYANYEGFIDFLASILYVLGYLQDSTGKLWWTLADDRLPTDVLSGTERG